MISSYEVISFTETKLDSKVTPRSIAVSGYNVHRQDRTNNGGGVINYISTKIKAVQLHDIQDRYVNLGLEVSLSELSLRRPVITLVILGVYRPPQSKSE